MPSMDDIYAKHAIEYDELVCHEDYQGNLRRFLRSTFDFTGKTVLELGTGTGRVTELYIDQIAKAFCFDRSSHMLAQARANLGAAAAKIEFAVAENLKPLAITPKVDFVIEGWSFGHSIMNHQQEIDAIVKTLVDNCASQLNDSGTVIIIETLGSNVAAPHPPTEPLGTFYQKLEQEYGFKRHVIKTDYQFPGVAEAIRIFSYFFGAGTGQGIQERNSPIIPEFTGVWSWRKP